MHTITPQRASLHGKWSNALDPVVRIEPGEVVRWENVLDVAWGLADAQIDVRTSQLVDGVRGVHARLHPKVFS